MIGEATPERIALVRKATVVVEEELAAIEAFQYMAILHEDRVTGMRGSKRQYAFQIEIRCWDSQDAVTASPTRLSFDLLRKMADRMTSEVPDVVSITHNIATKPPSTIEAVLPSRTGNHLKKLIFCSSASVGQTIHRRRNVLLLLWWQPTHHDRSGRAAPLSARRASAAPGGF